jgi:hypothetical protein
MSRLFNKCCKDLSCVAGLWSGNKKGITELYLILASEYLKIDPFP